MSVYYVQDTVPVLIHLILGCRVENNLPKISEVLSVRVRIWTQSPQATLQHWISKLPFLCQAEPEVASTSPHYGKDEKNW
jgi:hypothetical protein